MSVSKTLYASLYFSHVTKISVSLAAITLFIYRGVCRPYKRGVTLDFLFPINWILVGGGLGVFIDLIKFLIYIFGAVYNVIFSTRNWCLILHITN